MSKIRRAFSHVGIMQDFARDYVDRSRDTVRKDVHYWANLATYELADVIKHVVYKTGYSGKRWNKVAVEEAWGEALLALLILGEKAGLDCTAGALAVIDKFNEQEWKRKQ